MLKKLNDLGPVLKNAYERGKSVKELAAFYQVSVSTIWHRLREQGVEMRKRGPASKKV